MIPNGGRRKPPRRIPEVLTADEQTLLLAQLNPKTPSGIRNLSLICIMLNAGLSAREVRDLQIRNLDLKSGQLNVRGRDRKERIIWLSDDDLALLKKWLSFRDSSSILPRSSSKLVFTSLDGTKPICGRWLRKMVKRLGEKAGVSVDLHPHMLRNSFAADLLRQTQNLQLVQKSLGHASLSTTEIYTHIVQDELEDVMKNFRKG